MTKDNMRRMLLCAVFLVLSVPLMTCQNVDPVPDFPIHNITVKNIVYRFEFQMPATTFTDNMDTFDQLKLEWLLVNGEVVPSDSWVQLDTVKKHIHGFVSKSTYQNEPAIGYEYMLKATDSDGNTGSKIYNFKLGVPPQEPNYKRFLKLTSQSSIVYSRNYVETLFDIQDRLLQYSKQNNLGINELTEFITEDLKITKVNNVASIELTWSVTSFVYNECQLQSIINLRSKTVGTYQQNYRNTFQPLYQFTSEDEMFNGVCSYISADPAEIGTALGTFNIVYGNAFSINVSPGAFKPPSAGSTMSLTVQLRSSDGAALSKTSWINLSGGDLSQNVKVEGYASYAVASAQTSFTYRLVALTPLLVETYRNIDVSIGQFQTMQENYIVAFMSSSVITAQYSTFVRSFVSTISSFLSISASSIIVFSYENTQANTVLKWTITSFTAGCDINLSSSYTAKMLTSTGRPNEELRAAFNAIGFPLAQISIKVGETCQKPVINTAIGQITFTWGTFFQYFIAMNAYVDARDGTNLQFSMVYTDSTFSSSNWLSVNSTTRTIYGVPILKSITTGQTYNFKLRISNSIGNYVEDSFSITSTIIPPTFSYRYKMRIQYSSYYQSMASVLLTFLKRLYAYFGDLNTSHLLVQEVITFVSERKMEVIYYNTSFRITPCDTKSITTANVLLFDGVKPNPALKNAMQPDLDVLDVNSISDCPPNTPPSINPNKLPEEAGPHFATWGSFFQATLSDNLFYDEEDGGTRNLLITLKSISSNYNLLLSSWIYYEQASFTVYAVPMDVTFQMLGSNSLLKYILRAEDSGGLGVSTEYIMQLSGSVSNLYKVTYVMEVYNIATSSYAYQLIQMFSDLWSILGTKYERKMCVRSYQVTSTTGNNAVATLVWTPCNLGSTTCDFSIINEIRSKLFVDGTTDLKQEVTRRFTNFKIRSITEIGTGSCGLNPPTTSYQIPTLQISFCGVFRYSIPQNAFIDLEDGNTRNLNISLTNADGAALSSTSWVHFDSSKQEITTLLQQSMYSSTFQRSQILKLTATDKSKLSTTQTITFNVNGDSIQTDYKVIFQTRLSFVDTNANTFIRFADKVGNYYDDNGVGFEAISSRQTADGATVFEFGNCTIPYSPCNAVELNNYKNKLKNTDGSWRQSFQNMLLPEFTQVFISDSIAGPCADDEAPKSINVWGPLYVEIYKTYIIRVPENTFHDKEEGSTRNLQLELQNLNGLSLASNFWVSFDVSLQSVTIVATKAIAMSLPFSKLTLTLYAYDSNRKSASQTLEIIINYSSTEASHYFSMQFTTFGFSFVTIFNQFRTSVVTYFGDDVSIGTVSFHSATNNFASTLTVVWSNRTISSTKCENAKINYMLSKIFTTGNGRSPLFVSAMSTFTIIDLKFYYDGICKAEQQSPELKNPISALSVTFCNNIEYLIPANTFSDVIDGNSRSLTLTMTNLDDTVLQLDSFVYFHQQTQIIRVTPFTSAFTNVLFPKRYSYVLKATNTRGLYVTTNVHVDITTAPPPYSYSFQMTGSWLKQQNQPIPIADIISEFQLKSSSYIGYQSRSNLHVVQAIKQSQTSTTFSIKATSCLIGYDPCDNNNIALLQNKLFSTTGETFNSDYFQNLLPNIQLLSLTEEKVGPCKVPNKPPTQFRPIPTVILNACSTFEYKLSPQTFKDEEDGFTLNYVIIYINRMTINMDTTWIYNTINKDILATVNNEVVAGRGNNGYTLTIRAFDSEQAFVDASWNIQISGKQHQTFYKIILDVASKTTLQQAFVERYYLTKYINGFFNANYTNVISVQLLQNNNIRFVWSSCSLPDHCDTNSANIFFMNMKVGNNFVNQFVSALSPRYTLNDVSMQIHDTCQGPISPPIPSRVIWTLRINQCGGMRVVVPIDMFTDPEDGNTRTLATTFTKSDGSVLPEWIHYDIALQIITAFPTRSEGVLFNADPYQFKLTATDKTGLSAFVTVPIIVTIPVEPKYVFNFQYTVSGIGNKVSEMLAFSQKLSSYLGSTQSQVGVTSYTFSSLSTSRSFKYGDCSITYNPCDLASLTQLRSRFINSNNLPNTAFQDAMFPQYNIQFTITEQAFPCDGVVPNPPRVVKPLPTLIISLCGFFQYVIPADTFYDLQDGDTRQLSLSLSTPSGQLIANDSWIQFNTVTQTVYAMLTAADAMTNTNGFSYRLKATDSSQLPVETSLNIETTGEHEIVQECQIRVDFSSVVTSSKVDRLQYLASRLQTYFQLTSIDEIAISKYVNISSTKFQLYWTYCSATYRTSSTNTVVDYYSLATKILMKLFLNDRKTVSSSFYNAFGSSYTVESVATQFTERCKNLPPIVYPYSNQIRITLSSCGYTQRNLPSSLFYDFEQGGTSSLQLVMYLSDGIIPVPVNNWVNVDIQSQSIIAVCDDNVRKLIPGSYTYVLKAIDDNGKTAQLNIILEKFQQIENQVSPFEITFEMKYNGPASRSFVYQSKFASERIKAYYQMTNSPAVLVKTYNVANGYTQYRKMTWTTCEYQSCSSSVLSKTRSLHSESGLLPAQFTNAFLSDLTVFRVYYTTSCNPPTQPPINLNPIPPAKLQHCSLFSYKVTSSIFDDTVDGDVKNLNVQMFDSLGRSQLKSSWIRFNTAEMEIYAINIASKSPNVSSSTFMLTASNSGKLSSTSVVRVELDNKPFTVDCPITMTFRYKYVTSQTADLDVLWLVVKTVQRYYSDSNIMIKVLDFYQMINGDYYMKWSNCTFVYNTQEEANKGLTESYRTAVTAIFTKLLNTITQQINTNFQNVMNEMFLIKTLTISYECIEANPYPSNTNEYVIYIKPCELYKHTLPNNLFVDEKDVDIRNMKISLSYTNGQTTSSREWLQVNENANGEKYIYGMVSEQVKAAAPLTGYRYLIRCTDSSGRSATLPLVAYVLQQATSFNNIFTVGFRSYISSSYPATYVLAQISEKIAKYIDQSDTSVQLFINGFDANSYIQFSQCNLPCNENTYSEVFTKFQATRFRTTPAFPLIQTMRPQFDINYAYVSAPNCVNNNNETITPQPCPSIELSNCGWFSSVLGSQCFSDSRGKNTQSFLTNALQTDSMPLAKSSWIQYDIVTQSFYGIPIWNQVSETQSYKVVATHPASGNSATSLIYFQFKSYTSVTSANDKICQVTMQFEDNEDKEVNDVTVLRKLLEKISAYSNTNTGINSYLVMQFSRFNNIISVTYSNCTWLQLLQNTDNVETVYLQEVVKVLNQYFVMTGNTVVGVKPSFRSYLSSDFVFRSLSTSSGCSNTPTRPPYANKELTITLEKQCGKFAFNVPDDTFTDARYGNTRKLTLKLQTDTNQDVPKSTWVNIDNEQNIYGLIDKLVHENQPVGGYTFILRATNPDDQFAITRVIIIIPNLSWTVEISSITISLSLIPAPEYDLDYKLAVINQLESYSLFAAMKEGFFIQSFTATGSIINAKVAYCYQCDPFNYVNIMYLRQNTQNLQIWLARTLLMYGITTEMQPEQVISSMCASQDDPPVQQFEKSFTLCTENVFHLTDMYNSFIETLTVDFLTTTGNNVPTTSWIYLFNNPYRLVAFPTKDMIGQRFDFLLRIMKNGIVVGDFQKIRFSVNDVVPSVGQKYTLSLTGNSNLVQPDVFLISQVWLITQNYIGGAKTLQHISYTKISDNPLNFDISWYNCSLPCGATNIEDINSKLLQNGGISTQYASQFLPSYTASSLSTSCIDDPPIVNKTYAIIIPFCGVYVHKLPNTFAYDTADGYLDNLLVNLKKTDGSSISRSSWIQFDATRKEITAVANEDVINTTPVSGWRYLIYVTDSSQKTSITTLIVSFESSMGTFLTLALSFQSNYAVTTNYIEMQKNVMEYVSSYIGDNSISNYQAYAFRKQGTTESYYLEISNCSINRYVCQSTNVQVRSIESQIKQSDGTVNPSFVSYVQANSGGKVAMTSATVNYNFILDSPPRTIGTIPTVYVTYCSGKRYKIPDNVFVDDEDQDNLIYTANNVESAQIIPIQSWVHMYENFVYIFPSITSAPGTFNYRITGTDKCGQATSTMMSVNLSGQQTNSPYSMTIRFERKLSLPFSYEIWNIQEAMKKCYDMISTTIRSESFLYFNNYMEYKWSDCELKTNPCDTNTIDKINVRTFSYSTILSENIKTCFQPNYILQNANVYRVNTCVPSANPPTANYVPQATTRFCQKMNFQIPIDVFSSNLDGNTRGLKLELLTINLNPLPSTEWVQFDENNQLIYGYARTGESIENVETSFTYKLKATDSSGAYAFTSVIITILGEIPSLTYFMMLSARSSAAFQNNIDEEIKLISTLKEYFNQENLNDVSFTRASQISRDFTFKWTFCQFPKNECTCDNIRQYRELMLDTKTVSTTMQPNYLFTSITDEKKGECLRNENPVALSPIPNNNIPVGRCYGNVVPENAFYDTEDGNTRNLTLYLRTISNEEFAKNYWIQMDSTRQKICGILTYRSFQDLKLGVSTNYPYEYTIIAKDRCLNEVSRKVVSTIDIETYPKQLNYMFYMVLYKRQGDLMSDCADIDLILYKIANYSGNYNKTDILVEYIEVYNDTSANYTEIAWGYRNLSEKNCTNGTINELRRRFILDNNETNPIFISYMNPNYEVVSVRNKSFEECLVGPASFARLGADDEFDWWIIWLLLALALLLLLLWLLWLCCPRCCPNLCTNCCGVCGCAKCCAPCIKCCTPAGNYSSIPKKNSIAEPEDVEGGVAAMPRDEADQYEPAAQARPTQGDEDSVNGGVAAMPKDEPDPITPAAQAAPVQGDNDSVDGGVAAMPRDEESPDSGVDEEIITAAAPVVQDESAPANDYSSGSRRTVSESSIRMATAADEEHEAEFNFSDFEKSIAVLPQIPQQIKTESYYDARNDSMYRNKEIVANERHINDSFHTHMAQPYRLSNERSMYIERYPDRKPRNIKIIEDYRHVNSKPMVVPEPRVIEHRRRQPTRRVVNLNKRRSKHYRYTDALIDEPIVVEVKDSQRRHTRRKSEGEAILLRSSNRQKTTSSYRKKSVSPRRRRYSVSPVRRRLSLSPMRRRHRKPVVSRVADAATVIRHGRGRPVVKVEKDIYNFSSKQRIPSYTLSKQSYNSSDTFLDDGNIGALIKTKVSGRATGKDKSTVVHFTSTSDSGISEEMFFSPKSKKRTLILERTTKPITTSSISRHQSNNRNRSHSPIRRSTTLNTRSSRVIESSNRGTREALNRELYDLHKGNGRSRNVTAQRFETSFNEDSRV